MTFSTEYVQRKKKVRSTLVILLNPRPGLWTPPSWINFLFCNMIKNTKTYLPPTQYWMIKFNKNPILKDEIDKKNLKDKKIKWNEMLIKKTHGSTTTNPKRVGLKEACTLGPIFIFLFIRSRQLRSFFEKKIHKWQVIFLLKKKWCQRHLAHNLHLISITCYPLKLWQEYVIKWLK